MNGYVILPFIFKKLEQINNDEIEKEKITKSIIFLVATIIFIFVFENTIFKIKIDTSQIIDVCLIYAFIVIGAMYLLFRKYEK